MEKMYRILADVVVVVAHVKAQSMIYECSLLCIFRIDWILWRIFIAQILHNCNTFAQQKPIVVKDWNLFLRVQLDEQTNNKVFRIKIDCFLFSKLTTHLEVFVRQMFANVEIDTDQLKWDIQCFQNHSASQ